MVVGPKPDSRTRICVDLTKLKCNLLQHNKLKLAFLMRELACLVIANSVWDKLVVTIADKEVPIFV